MYDFFNYLFVWYSFILTLEKINVNIWYSLCLQLQRSNVSCSFSPGILAHSSTQIFSRNTLRNTEFELSPKILNWV